MTRFPHYIWPVFLLGLLFAAGAARAGAEPLTYDRVTLEASAEAAVPNDLLTTVVFTQGEGENAVRLADQVNRAIEWGVQEAKKVKGVTVRTLDYRTTPIYTQQTLTGWRVRHAIRLESRDGAALSQLIGRLQNRLSVESIGYRLSPERQREAENELIAEAMSSFKHRAQLITRQLQRSGYRLVEMQVTTGATLPRPMPQRAFAMEMRAESVRPPVLEAGTQKVKVQVTGTVELKVR